MSGTRGYFKDGIWIEEPVDREETGTRDTSEAGRKETSDPGKKEPSEAGEEAPDVEELVGDTKESVKNAVNSVIALGKNLFGTETGRKHLEKEARKAGDKLEEAIEDAVDTAKKEFEKAKEKAKR